MHSQSCRLQTIIFIISFKVFRRTFLTKLCCRPCFSAWKRENATGLQTKSDGISLSSKSSARERYCHRVIAAATRTLLHYVVVLSRGAMHVKLPSIILRWHPTTTPPPPLPHPQSSQFLMHLPPSTRPFSNQLVNSRRFACGSWKSARSGARCKTITTGNIFYLKFFTTPNVALQAETEKHMAIKRAEKQQISEQQVRLL
jgi:hypothetical protein